MKKYFSINKEFKKFLPIFLIMLSILFLMGTSYALLRSSQVGENTYVMKVGLLEVTFVDSKTNALTIQNMKPMTDKEGISQTEELSFTLKNTGEYITSYDVYIEETSISPAFKTMIRFISNKNGAGYTSPKTLSEDYYIAQGGILKVGEEATYKVKAWLSENADSTYMKKTFTARIVVVANQVVGELFTDVVKGTLGSEKGVIAVNTEGTLYNATDTSQTIREYRYSGADVNNYVTFNNETWRIIGVFSEELADGRKEEFVKIVRDSILSPGSMPTSYYIASQENTYTVATASTSGSIYWNKPATLKATNYNDWTTAGIMYYLNTEKDDSETPNVGYLSKLTTGAKELIRESTYYLGNYKYSTDTTITGYESERSGDIWSGNQAIWRGKVGLMYPSDYGYSASNSYWTSILYNWKNAEEDGTYARDTSWMYKTANHIGYEWLFSSAASSMSVSALWASTGYVSDTIVNSNANSVRPSLYLKSEAKVIAGDGSKTNPYLLQEG